MKIKVIRDYSGAEGSDVDRNVRAGSEHVVTRARGNELHANGLAEIVDDEAYDEENKPMADEKKAEPVTNKAAPVPPNKAAPKLKNKAGKA